MRVVVHTGRMDSRYIYLEIGGPEKKQDFDIGILEKVHGKGRRNGEKVLGRGGLGVYSWEERRSGNIYLGKKRKNRKRHTHTFRSLRPVWRCHGVAYIVTMDT